MTKHEQIKAAFETIAKCKTKIQAAKLTLAKLGCHRTPNSNSYIPIGYKGALYAGAFSRGKWESRYNTLTGQLLRLQPTMIEALGLTGDREHMAQQMVNLVNKQRKQSRKTS